MLFSFDTCDQATALKVLGLRILSRFLMTRICIQTRSPYSPNVDAHRSSRVGDTPAAKRRATKRRVGEKPRRRIVLFQNSRMVLSLIS